VDNGQKTPSTRLSKIKITGISFVHLTMPPLPSFLDIYAQKWLDLLAYLSALTLGDIWAKVYNPPTPLSISIALIAILYKAPEYWQQYVSWRASRRVIAFAWPLPSVSSFLLTLGPSSWEASPRWLEWACDFRTRVRLASIRQESAASRNGQDGCCAGTHYMLRPFYWSMPAFSERDSADGSSTSRRSRY